MPPLRSFAIVEEISVLFGFLKNRSIVIDHRSHPLRYRTITSRRRMFLECKILTMFSGWGNFLRSHSKLLKPVDQAESISAPPTLILSLLIGTYTFLIIIDHLQKFFLVLLLAIDPNNMGVCPFSIDRGNVLRSYKKCK